MATLKEKQIIVSKLVCAGNKDLAYEFVRASLPHQETQPDTEQPIPEQEIQPDNKQPIPHQNKGGGADAAAKSYANQIANDPNHKVLKTFMGISASVKIPKETVAGLLGSDKDKAVKAFLSLK